MSKGNRLVPVRFNPHAFADLVAEVARYNANPLNEQISLSDFIRRAVVDKIGHAKRSRSPRKADNDNLNQKLSQLADELHGIQMRIADDSSEDAIDHG